MANVSILGGTTGEVTIPTNSSAVAAAVQAALAVVGARITNGTDLAETYAGVGTVPQPTHPSALTLNASVNLTMPAASAIDAIISDASGPISIDDERATPVTVVSGSGGLTYTRTAANAGPALVLVSGGTNSINLGLGAATVAADGATSISALGGAASILAGAAGFAMVRVGGADTVTLLGTDTVSFAAAATAAVVTAADGSNVVIASGAGQLAPVVTAAPGVEAIGTLAGSTATVAGSLGGLLMVSAWGGRTFINPGAANVTVPMFSGGSGSETLFGAGDASLPGVTVPAGMTLANTGSDFIFGGTGYFHGGSGALNVLVSTTVAGATTLIGGGSVDIMFAQGAQDSMRGAAGTVVMDAAGFVEPGFSIAGAGAGVTLDAGRSNAFMFGSAWGANTILSGAGAATVFGNHGIATKGGPGQVGNVYVDGGGGGSLAILDFLPGADVLRLNGATLSGIATVAAGGAQAPGTYVTLSDGAKIGFVDQFLTQTQINAALR